MAVKKTPMQEEKPLTEVKTEVKSFSITCKNWANKKVNVGGTILSFNADGVVQNVDAVTAGALTGFKDIIIK